MQKEFGRPVIVRSTQVRFPGAHGVSTRPGLVRQGMHPLGCVAPFRMPALKVPRSDTTGCRQAFAKIGAAVRRVRNRTEQFERKRLVLKYEMHDYGRSSSPAALSGSSAQRSRSAAGASNASPGPLERGVGLTPLSTSLFFHRALVPEANQVSVRVP